MNDKNKSELLKAISSYKIIVMLRDIEMIDVFATCKLLLRYGIRVIEITMTSPQAIKSIDFASNHFGDKMAIGAGTVLTAKQAEGAISAGAQFIVSPNNNPAVIEATLKKSLISIASALTPTEIWNAHIYGVDVVEILSIDSLGINYYKSVKNIYPDINFMLTGGVDLTNVNNYINSSAWAVDIGSILFTSRDVQKGKFDLHNLEKKLAILTNMVH